MHICFLLRSGNRAYKFFIPSQYTLCCNNNLASHSTIHASHTALIYDRHTSDPNHVAY